MDLEFYFKPVDLPKIKLAPWAQKKFSLLSVVEKNHAKLSIEKAEVVIIGIGEDRNSIEKGSADAPDKVREHLYSLNRIDPRFKLLDLGNLVLGQTANDSYFALKDVCEELIQNGKVVIVIGGSQDLTIGLAKAFEDKTFSLVNIDPKFDYQKGSKSITSENYLNLIFEKHPNLFSQTTLGYQNYFTDSLELDHAGGLLSETVRLGLLRYNMIDIEPYLRQANLLSFDLNAVRQIEAPGQYFASPNGLYAEEACQLARYAGLSNSMKIAGFFNLIPNLDPQEIGAKLMAQIIWHFLEGMHSRIDETPPGNEDNFNHFLVELEDIDLPITFYQSRKTGRWWMQITDEQGSFEEIIPCTQEDYELTARNEIPDRWWRNIRKLNRLVK
ncbi:formimidoylglutamase [Sunxiuqinia sp. A32]|uniref:formimidoylglutamase n=1 Tax=Sunxiuqinia sp. A32 TaxID=3461496 RepID=UPI0040464C00